MGSVGIVYIAVTVTLGQQTHLFWGIASGFAPDQDGNPDRLYLYAAQRREFAKDWNPSTPDESRFYPIEGDILIIPYKSITSLNLEYILAEPLPDEVPSDPAQVEPEQESLPDEHQ